MKRRLKVITAFLLTCSMFCGSVTEASVIAVRFGEPGAVTTVTEDSAMMSKPSGTPVPTPLAEGGQDEPDKNPVESPKPSGTPVPTPPAEGRRDEPDENPAGFSKSSVRLKKGRTKKLKLCNVTGKVTWSSSNKKVATVSAEGIVKGKKAGVATIKAKSIVLNKTFKCKVTIYEKLKPAEVTKRILALKKKYPEGKKWTNDDYYYWKAVNLSCSGCYAFVGIVSDKVFGKHVKVKRHHSFKKVKAGDHIRIGDYHSVIVIKKAGNTVTVAEGNYYGAIRWGRKIEKSSLTKFFIETRY